MESSVLPITSITPSIIPKSLQAKKLFNSGDLYVRELTRKYLFENRVDFNNFSYWEQDKNNVVQLFDELSEHKEAPLIVAGTNCLSDQFSLLKNVNPSLLRPIIKEKFTALCFVGLFGAEHPRKKHNFNFDQESFELLETILTNGIVSCRCQTTYDSLKKVFPHYQSNIYLTGCVTAAPLINFYKNFSYCKNNQPRILFSVTCRNDSGSAEANDLAYLIKLFGSESIHIIFNQNRLCNSLKAIIKSHNIKIINAENMNHFQYYNTLASFDLHIGSRAHVHIPMISLGIRSILTGFELRHSSFQSHYKNDLIFCGDLNQYSSSHLLYDKSFECLKDRLISDTLGRNRFKNRIRSEINIATSTFNVVNANQWVARQQKALEVLESLDIKTVTELGPGYGSLADKLKSKNIKYRGFDVIKRRDYIESFDINKEKIILPAGLDDCLLFLGVLEYIEEPLRFIQTWLRTYQRSIFTYNAKTASASADLYSNCVSNELRSSLEWRNTFTLDELKALLLSNGISVSQILQTKYSENNRLYCEYLLVVESNN